VAHADQIVPRVSLDDVVVEDAVRDQIANVIGAVRARGTVFASWGFDKGSASGRGIAALFSGPSGTGKSALARAVAKEAGANLVALGVDHNFSKLIKVYLNYSLTQNEDNSSYTMSGDGHGDKVSAAAKGEDVQGVSLGMMYSF
jgi:hypothetical protein